MLRLDGSVRMERTQHREAAHSGLAVGSVSLTTVSSPCRDSSPTPQASWSAQ